MNGLRPLWIPAFAGMTIAFSVVFAQAHCCQGYFVDCRTEMSTTAQAGTQARWVLMIFIVATLARWQRVG